MHTQFGQHYKGSSSERTSSASTPPSKSPRDSVERNILPPSTSEKDKFSDHLLSSSSQTTSESLKQDKSTSSRKVVPLIFRNSMQKLLHKIFKGSIKHNAFATNRNGNTTSLSSTNSGGSTDTICSSGLGYSRTNFTAWCDHVTRWFHGKWSVFDIFTLPAGCITSIHVS